MSLPRVYIESTIPSYLAARPSRDLVLRGQQEATRRWWQCREGFVCYVSAIVEMEIMRGDQEAAEKRMQVIAGMPRLRISQEVQELASRILSTGLIPPKAELDASHIAIAAVHGMDLLVTWNCTHIHNVFIHRKIVTICESMDYPCPEICTPFDLVRS